MTTPKLLAASVALLLTIVLTPQAHCMDAGSAAPVEEPALTVLQQATLHGLQTAYKEEMNDRDRCSAYARRADQEGYGQVASLLRAMAHADEIHALNHLEAMKTMSSDTISRTLPVNVDSTRKNLESVVTRDSYKTHELYPMLAEQALRDGDRTAEQSFRFAMSADSARAVFCQQAVRNLDDYKGKAAPFLVCPVCGRICRSQKGACPVCSTSREQLATIK